MKTNLTTQEIEFLNENRTKKQTDLDVSLATKNEDLAIKLLKLNAPGFAEKYNILLRCIENKLNKVAKFILKSDKKLFFYKNSNNYSILHFAVWFKNFKFVKFLVKEDLQFSNLNSLNKWNQRPLDLAIFISDFKTADFLRKHYSVCLPIK